MDLRQFVAATLKQIVEGVADAAPAISALGGAVSPAFYPRHEGEHLGRLSTEDKAPVYAVTFDVAVIASTADSAEATGGIRIAGVGFGGKMGSADKEETTSRIKFVVPLQLPTDPKTSQRLADEAAAAARTREEMDRKIKNSYVAR